jgi:alpha-ribazole phosphatase
MLQFRDFMEARRSLENYIDDLKHNLISYREYDFNDGEVTEIKKNKPLDERHRGEFSYHIIRNLITNYLKLCNKTNDSFSNNEVISEIKRLFPENGKSHAKQFDLIAKKKSQRADIYPKNTLKWATTFLNEFQLNISGEWREAVPIRFTRHYKTNLNNGTYLGQGRDPGIDKSITSYPEHEPTSMVYSSPMRRCLETSKEIWKDRKITTDDRLLEFDYGHAEGLYYDQLVAHYPEMSAGWKKGKDPRFPGGENTTDVFGRFTSFLEHLSEVITNHQIGPISIFTHNGVLRCLLGEAFGLDRKDWYKLIIPHGVPLEFLFRQNRFYPNISRSLWSEILKNIGYSTS